MLNMSVINGSTSLASSSVWDGDADDMSMDLLTDIDEGSTDEEASSYHHSKGLEYLTLVPRWQQPSLKSNPCTHARYCI